MFSFLLKNTKNYNYKTNYETEETKKLVENYEKIKEINKIKTNEYCKRVVENNNIKNGIYNDKKINNIITNILYK